MIAHGGLSKDVILMQTKQDKSLREILIPWFKAVFWAFAFALSRLRETPSAAATAFEEEGLANRLLRLSRQSASVEELILLTKCKRYTRARISRLITELCLMLPKAPERVPYLHLLGARRDADPLLKELNHRARLKPTSGAPELMDSECFQAECRAADLWGLSTAKPEYRRAGRALTTKFLRV